MIYNLSSFIFMMIFQGMEGGQDGDHSFKLPPPSYNIKKEILHSILRPIYNFSSFIFIMIFRGMEGGTGRRP